MSMLCFLRYRDSSPICLLLSIGLVSCGGAVESDELTSTTQSAITTRYTASIDLPAGIELDDVAVAAVNGNLALHDRVSVINNPYYYPWNSDHAVVVNSNGTYWTDLGVRSQSPDVYARGVVNLREGAKAKSITSNKAVTFQGTTNVPMKSFAKLTYLGHTESLTLLG